MKVFGSTFSDKITTHGAFLAKIDITAVIACFHLVFKKPVATMFAAKSF